MVVYIYLKEIKMSKKKLEPIALNVELASLVFVVWEVQAAQLMPCKVAGVALLSALGLMHVLHTYDQGSHAQIII